MLNRYWFLGLLLFILPCPAALFAQERKQDSVTVTEAVRRNALIRILREREIPFEERSLFADYGGFGSSLHIAIPRSAEPESGGLLDALVLGIPLFSPEPGEELLADDQLPFGFEVGLAFIEAIRGRGSALNIQVAFLGDEVSRLPEDMQKRPHKGLEDLYTAMAYPETSILLYLDMPAAPQSILIRHGAEQSLTALNVLKPLYSLCKSHSIPYSFAVRFNELYKLNLVKGHPVMQFARDRGINALYLAGPQNLRHNKALPDLSAEVIAGLLIDYAAESLTISTDNMDYHFLILQFFKSCFFISESLTVQLFLFVIGFCFTGILIYGIVRREALIVQWQIFISYLWVFPAFLVSLVLTLEIAGALISLLTGRFEDAPLSNDFGWAGFKIIIALLLLSLQFSFWNMLKIPKKAVFYGNAAVILVILGVLMAVFLDITFIPIFIWILLFTLLGAIIKIPVLVYSCALIAPLQSFGQLLNILEFHDTAPYSKGSLLFSAGRLTEIILSKNILTSLYIAVIILPFLLLVERGIGLAQKKTGIIPKRRRFFLISAILLLSLGSLVFYTFKLAAIPYTAPVRRTLIDDPSIENILHIRLGYLIFLERRSIRIDLEMKGNPLNCNLYLETADKSPPVIYAAPMPFTFINDGKEAAFILGEGPPNPFSTEIILPADFSGSLRIEAIYTAWDPAIDPMPRPEGSDYVFKAVKTINLNF